MLFSKRLPVSRDEIVCSANGRAFTIAADRRIPEILGRLNRGEPCRMSVLRQYSSRGDRLPPAEGS